MKQENILSSAVNRRLGQAMLDYSMLADGDRVLVAVSGGIDSLVLAWLLVHWRRKAPIDYYVHALHVDMELAEEGTGAAAAGLAVLLAKWGIAVHVLPAVWQPPVGQGEEGGGHRDICFQCARSRRNQLFEYARQHGFTRLALGHHRDDIIETFFLNLTCAGNISTMVPCQPLFSGRLAIIRPLSYLNKSEVEAMGRRLGLQPLRSRCPLSEKTRRREIHEMLTELYRRIPGARGHIFAALGNVRTEYLLKPTHHEDR